MQLLDVSANRPFTDILQVPTVHPTFRTQQGKGQEILELVCAPQPDSAEENTKQVDGGYFCHRPLAYHFDKGSRRCMKAHAGRALSAASQVQGGQYQ